MPTIERLYDLGVRAEHYYTLEAYDYVCEAGVIEDGSEWCNDEAAWECVDTLSHDGRYLCDDCHEQLESMWRVYNKDEPRRRRLPK